mgnify:CR=1 FL=1
MYVWDMCGVAAAVVLVVADVVWAIGPMIVGRCLKQSHQVLHLQASCRAVTVRGRFARRAPMHCGLSSC